MTCIVTDAMWAEFIQHIRNTHHWEVLFAIALFTPAAIAFLWMFRDFLRTFKARSVIYPESKNGFVPDAVMQPFPWIKKAVKEVRLVKGIRPRPQMARRHGGKRR